MVDWSDQDEATRARGGTYLATRIRENAKNVGTPAPAAKHCISDGTTASVPHIATALQDTCRPAIPENQPTPAVMAIPSVMEVPRLSVVPCAAHALLAFVAFALFSAARQVLFRPKTEPPAVFHWIPYVGNAVSYGMDPVAFLNKYRAKVTLPPRDPTGVPLALTAMQSSTGTSSPLPSLAETSPATWASRETSSSSMESCRMSTPRRSTAPSRFPSSAATSSTTVRTRSSWSRRSSSSLG